MTLMRMATMMTMTMKTFNEVPTHSTTPRDHARRKQIADMVQSVQMQTMTWSLQVQPLLWIGRTNSSLRMLISDRKPAGIAC